MMLPINYPFRGESLLYVSTGTLIELYSGSFSARAIGEQENVARLCGTHLLFGNWFTAHCPRNVTVLGFLGAHISNRLPYQEDGMCI
jgi:hypothetical protein